MQYCLGDNARKTSVHVHYWCKTLENSGSAVGWIHAYEAHGYRGPTVMESPADGPPANKSFMDFYFLLYPRQSFQSVFYDRHTKCVIFRNQGLFLFYMKICINHEFLCREGWVQHTFFIPSRRNTAQDFFSPCWVLACRQGESSLLLQVRKASGVAFLPRGLEVALSDSPAPTFPSSGGLHHLVDSWAIVWLSAPGTALCLHCHCCLPSVHSWGEQKVSCAQSCLFSEFIMVLLIQTLLGLIKF